MLPDWLRRDGSRCWLVSGGQGPSSGCEASGSASTSSRSIRASPSTPPSSRCPHGLRTLDALHLAAALTLAGRRARSSRPGTFACTAPPASRACGPCPTALSLTRGRAPARQVTQSGGCSVVQAAGSGSTGSGQRSCSGASRIRMHPRRDAGDDRVGRDVLGHDRVGADDRVVADADAAQDAGAVADPDVGADHDVALVDALLADRPLDFDHAVIEVDEHRPVGDHALLADPHPLVGGDRALLAHHRLGADLDPPLVAADLGPVADPDEAAEVEPALARAISSSSPRPKKTSPSVRQRRPAAVRSAATGSARAAARSGGSASRCGRGSGSCGSRRRGL